MTVQTRRQYLYRILGEVHRIAGFDAAMRLAFAAGGQHINVPARPTRRFIERVGPEAAHAISSLYPREAVMLPLGPFGSTQTANRVAREALQRGMSLTQSARVAGVTERTVVFIKRELKEDELLTRVAAPDLSALPLWLVETVSTETTQALELDLASLARLYEDRAMLISARAGLK